MPASTQLAETICQIKRCIHRIEELAASPVTNAPQLVQEFREIALLAAEGFKEAHAEQRALLNTPAWPALTDKETPSDGT